MIKLTKLNGEEFYVNPHQIEFVEKVPETLLKMLSGKTIYIRETPDELIQKIIDYRNKISLFKDTL